MALGLLGKKIGMTQIFDEDGSLIPVTLIQAGPCPVVHKRVMDRDGYEAVAIGYGEKKEKRVNKPDAGQYRRAGVAPCQIVREFRGAETQEFEVGQSLDISLFEDGERVDVIGTRKGRGFAGVLKRHNASPGPNSHGSMYHRRPGSNGAASYPSRTWKGKMNPGRMGAVRITVPNLQIVRRDAERNLLFVKGSIPGPNDSFIMVRKRA